MDHEDLFGQIVRGFADGIVALDATGRVDFANPSAEELLGVSPLAGRHVDDFLDEQGRRESAEHLRRAAGGEFLAHEVDTMLVRGDGQPLWVRLRQSRRLDGGRPAGVILRLSDNDESKRLSDQIATSRAELMRAERIARMGSWTWEVASNQVAWTEGLQELYGERTADLVSVSQDRLRSMTHPEDHKRHTQAYEGLISGATPEIDIEIRQLGGEGWMWVRMRAVGTYDDAGRLLRVAGTHQDITRARDTDNQLQDLVTQNSLMQAVATAANEATTLDEVLAQAQHLVVLHDDWERARAFVPTADATGVEPHYVSESDLAADHDRAETAELERRTAQECYATGRTVWDPVHRLTIAFAVRLGEEVVAVITITSKPPLYRHDMIVTMVEQAALQLSRVAERERAAQELAATRDRALEASRHKSEFLATMSHEIRTPLNGVIGLNELLQQTPMSTHQQHLVSGIAVSSRALLDVINDILDFSKIEAGHLELVVVDLEVREVLEQAASLLAESARAAGVELVVSCSPEVPEVLAGDPVRLHQVLLNLGSNAIKFTAEGSVGIRATSTASPDGGAVLRVEVSDTGIGIGAEEQARIFSPFTQADATTTRRYGGTGLGLAICAEIVRAFGGELGVESEQGSGSTFWFTAPLGPALGRRGDHAPASTHAAPQPQQPEPPTALSDPALAPGAAGPPVGAGQVLVVEDNAVNRIVARGLLESLGFAVELAEDGSEALAMLERGRYDVVLMDLQMPVLDGYAATRELRARERDRGSRRLPVVAMTAAAVTGERERCLAAGMDDFLTKPVALATLAGVLARWVPTVEAVMASAPRLPDDAPTSPHLDLLRLEELRELSPGDTGFLDRAIDGVLDRAPATVADLRRAVAQAQAATLASTAHALKGSALNLGLVTIGEQCRALEALGRSGTLTGAPAILTELEPTLESTLTALRAYRDWYHASA
ncbi:ATP-binding protein [Nocardioides nanhaiensis]|uniref:histidine kinase n=1 Tax=Nocardioides nanhaiensis TaxID=1476871 RepID=A0ABP8WQ94_9ACTN